MVTKFEADRDRMRSGNAVDLVIPGGRFTGAFGPRSQVPGAKGTSPNHKGIDITHDRDNRAPILAVESGRVVYSSRDAYGAMDLFIGRQIGKGLEGWRYVHNSHHYYGAGAFVAAGQRVALMGATGNVNGPHVHLERYVGGVPVDPVPYLLRLAGSMGDTPKPVPAPELSDDMEMKMYTAIYWSNGDKAGFLFVGNIAVKMDNVELRESLSRGDKGIPSFKIGDLMLSNMVAKSARA